MKSNGWQMLSRAQQQQHLLFNKIIPAPNKTPPTTARKRAALETIAKYKGQLETNVYEQKGNFATALYCFSLFSLIHIIKPEYL